MTIGFPGLDKKCEKKLRMGEKDGRKRWKLEVGSWKFDKYAVISCYGNNFHPPSSSFLPKQNLFPQNFIHGFSFG